MNKQKKFLKLTLIMVLVAASIVLHGQNEKPELGFVTIITEQSSKIYLDNQFMNCGKWYGEVQPGNHNIRIDKEGYYSINKQFSISNGQNLVINVEEPTERVSIPMVIQFTPKTFITLNGSINDQPVFALGLTVGYVKKFGCYLSFMTGFDFSALSADLTSSHNGYVYGSYPFYSGNKSRSRLSVIVGGIVSLNDNFAVRAGLGYGINKVAWETTSGTWINQGDEEVTGIDIALGVQGFINKFTLSGDLVTTNFKTIEFKFGFGLVIR